MSIFFSKMLQYYIMKLIENNLSKNNLINALRKVFVVNLRQFSIYLLKFNFKKN